jgi:hypothetical protein
VGQQLSFLCCVACLCADYAPTLAVVDSESIVERRENTSVEEKKMLCGSCVRMGPVAIRELEFISSLVAKCSAAQHLACSEACCVYNSP